MNLLGILPSFMISLLYNRRTLRVVMYVLNSNRSKAIDAYLNNYITFAPLPNGLPFNFFKPVARSLFLVDVKFH